MWHCRHVRTTAEDRRSLHLRRTLDVAHRAAPPTGRAQSRRLEQWGTGVAADHAPPARLRADTGRAVHVQHELELRGVDGQGDTRATRGVCKRELAGESNGRGGREPWLHRATMGDLRDCAEPRASRTL